MKKLKVFVAFSALVFLMSSCVYSLFPIFTDDTIVYLPELEGKWIMGNDPDSYITFDGGVEIESDFRLEDKVEIKSEEPSDPKVTTSFSIDFSDDEYIIENGDTIRDREKIKEYYSAQLEELQEGFAEKMGEAMRKFGKAMNGLATHRISNEMAFGFERKKEQYFMSVVNGSSRQGYVATVTKIGEDLFLDLSAAEGDQSEKNYGSRVWFPVHTFMKIEISENKLRLIQFDYEKMNKLFESNLVRLRHENVDGSILLTAQTSEMRKFLDKYSDDESVFEEVETYSKSVQ
ncbi:MAG: hypothetical protein HWE21_02645 [Cytophagia bacterium]|nr:hypothetical protein [Cytophagia bacterium]